MKILGIDPGLNNTGWGIIDAQGNEFIHIDSGVLKNHSNLDSNDRVYRIFCFLIEIIDEHNPEQAAIENTYVNSNYHTSLTLREARTAAIIALKHRNIAFAEYAAKTIKKTVVGYGNADKAQVIKMLDLMIPKDGKAWLKDEADSIAIAICHAIAQTLHR